MPTRSLRVVFGALAYFSFGCERPPEPLADGAVATIDAAGV